MNINPNTFEALQTLNDKVTDIAINTGILKEIENHRVDLIIETGGHELRVRVNKDTDFDDEFKALCLNSNETITVRGWMIDRYHKAPTAFNYPWIAKVSFYDVVVFMVDTYGEDEDELMMEDKDYLLDLIDEREDLDLLQMYAVGR